MKVNEKVVLEAIGLLTTCVIAYKEITLAKLKNEHEHVLAQGKKEVNPT